MKNTHNQGKKASTYTTTLPDGRRVTKKSMNVHTDEAYIAAYQHGGEWHVSGVSSVIRDWGTQQFFKAQKTSK